ncbi:MAG: CUB domain-containing protein, partial [Bacteroidota bacterium]|nr:T9SS type A sorting domain-containing protein [Candidatus Kapabacteria bacterium]MDW8220813.1 CUB domain-containing protein [Bacteroidota bacterium]
TFRDREGATLNRPYAHNQNTFWLIKPSNPLGTRLIVLRFDSLNTQRGRDIVRIFAGGSQQRVDTTRLITVVSGANPPPAIFVQDSAVTVQFLTDGSIAGENSREIAGWTITYFAFTNFYTASEGVVRDRENAALNAPYAHNLDALWLIRPIGARHILIEFDSLNIEDEYDYVTIITGLEEPRVIGRFTGVTLPPRLAVNDSLVVVRFTTDEEYAGENDAIPSGWKLRYTSATRATVLRPEIDNMNFGVVTLGEESRVQTLRISGSSFLDNLTIIAPKGFTIATSATESFRDTVVFITQKNSPQLSRAQLFIRFQPLIPGKITGRLVLRSGAVEEVVTLEGLCKPSIFWESTGGPYGGQVALLAAAAGNVLLAGTRSGIYRSNSSGAVWLSSNTGLLTSAAQRIRKIAVGQGNDILVYIATDAGLYFSVDTGKSWRSAPRSGLPNDVAVHAVLQYHGLTLIGTSQGLYRYVSARSRWERVMQGFARDNIEIRSLALYDSSIVAGTRDYGIFLSKDSAATWHPINGAQTPTSYAIPTRGYVVSSLIAARGHLLAIVDTMRADGVLEYVGRSEVYSTKNAGKTWRREDISELYERGARQIYSALLLNDVLYLGTFNGIARRHLSDTLGIWNYPRDPAATGLTESTVYQIVAHGSIIYVGTLGGVFRSNNQGLTWQAVNTGLTATRSYAMIHLRGTILAGTEGSGIFRSADNGASWQPSNNGLKGTAIAGFAVQGNTVFTGIYNDRTPGWANNGVFRSLDNGVSWTFTSKFPRSNTDSRPLTPQPDVYSIAVDDQNVLYAGTLLGDENYLFASTTGGISWRSIGLPSNALVDAPIYAIHDGPGAGIFLATYGEGVLFSPNPLAPLPEWTRLLVQSDDERADYARCFATLGNDVFVGTEAGLFRINASQTRCVPLLNAPKEIARSAILSLHVAYGMLYVGVSESGIWRTPDGISWERVNTGLVAETLLGRPASVNINADVYALVADESSLYAALDGNAVFRTSLVQPATSARVLLSIADTYSAQPGDTVTIDIKIAGTLNLPDLAPSQMPVLSGTLRCNASLLEPVDEETRLRSVVTNGERVVTFRAVLLSPSQLRMTRDSVLQRFRFRALLGNSVATPLILSNLSARDVSVIVRRPGLLTLTGLSSAGGVRLFWAESKPTLVLAPNPTYKLAIAGIMLPEPGYTSVTITNLFGQTVKVVAQGEMLAGEYNVPLDIGDLPQGMYIVRVQTATQSVARQLHLVK